MDMTLEVVVVPAAPGTLVGVQLIEIDRDFGRDLGRYRGDPVRPSRDQACAS